jgi:hypothetical protein
LYILAGFFIRAHGAVQDRTLIILIDPTPGAIV